MELWRVFLVEAEKTFKRLRTYIGFGAIGVAVPVLLIAFHASHVERSSDFAAIPRIGGFTIVGSFVNGLFLTRIVFLSMFVHVPFLVTLVAGDAVAGEASGGTLRLICTRPPSRLTVITAKCLMGGLYAFLLVLFLGVLTTALGVALFGSGPLLLSGRGITLVPEAEGYARVAGALLLGSLGMITVASLALLFSVVVTNPIGPIVGTMAVLIVFLIISNTPLRLFEQIRPYLFTTYTPVWTRAFDARLDWGTLARDAGVLVGHSLAFCAAAAAIFLRKDIVT